MTLDRAAEDALRQAAPRVLSRLVRRYGHFDACEDAVQDALLAAAVQWPRDGMPDEPAAWLTTVATRRLNDRWRSDQARRRREDADAALAPPPVDEPSGDDTLTLLFLCCHPALAPAAQVALTLRAVGGLSTAQIAHAFLVPEPTMGQRISRAKQRIRDAGGTLTRPAPGDLDERFRAVLHVVYLIFNEGYATTSGPDLLRVDLTAEAIRLARALHGALPGDGEVAGLLALLLLTDSHRAARTGPHGELVPLDEQDRTRWDRAQIDEGTDLVTHALASTPVGPYQVQAAIAAVHAEATVAAATDWPQILALYGVLARLAPSPVVTLNRAAALAMVEGPAAGLALLDEVDADTHRVAAVRAHLLEMGGDPDAARRSYLEAARRTTSLAEQRYLETRAARLV